MTHAEFHTAVAVVAGGRYCSTKVEATTTSAGKTKVEFSAYIDGRSWTESYDTAEEALAELTGSRHEVAKLEDIDPAPAVSL